MGPSNEMTCDSQRIIHPMDAIVCYAGCYYVRCRCDSYMNEDGGFGGEAPFGDIMLRWQYFCI